MAFTPVPSVATADLYTSANYNTYIAANFAAGVPDIFTAAGDIAYATAADVAARLAIGASVNHRLRTNSGLTAPEWSNISVPIVVRKTADETVTSSSTLQNDDVLLQAINASEIWVGYFLLLTSYTNALGGFKAAITVPASATLGFAGFHSGNGVTYGDTRVSGTAIVSNTAAGGFALLHFIVVNSTNAGNIQLQWAQSSANAAGATVQAMSVMVSTRIA